MRRNLMGGYRLSPGRGGRRSDEQQWESPADRAHPMVGDDGNATLAIAAGPVAALAGGVAWAAMVQMYEEGELDEARVGAHRVPDAHGQGGRGGSGPSGR